jgi:hypothetical protein
MKIFNEFLQWLAIFTLFGVLGMSGVVGWRFYQEHKSTIERVNKLNELLKNPLPSPGPLPLPWNPFRQDQKPQAKIQYDEPKPLTEEEFKKLQSDLRGKICNEVNRNVP